MNKDLLNDFDAFRRWFNANFSLSLNGKFAGIKRLRNWKLFAYRLYKYLTGRYRFSLNCCSDRLSFCLGSDKIKLYSR